MPEIAGLNLSTADGCETALNRVAGDGLLAFDRGGVRLDLTDNPPLDKLVAAARACGAQRIEIQSHTDNSGRRSNNLSLSRRRAIAVKDYLVKQGLSGDRLTAIGFGPDRPVASNRTDAGRAQNRRMEFRVIREESR